MTRQHQDYLHLLVVALVFVSVSRVHLYVPPLSAIQPAQTLGILAILYWVFNPHRARWANITGTWPGRGLLLLVALVCGSAVFGISQGRAGMFIINNYSKVIVLTVLIMATMRSVDHLRRFTWSFVLGAGTIAFISVFVAGISKTSSHYSYDANDAGLFMAMGIPLAVWLARTTKGKGRWLAVVAAVLMLITAVQSESRGTFVGLVAVGLGLAVLETSIPIVKRAAVVGVAAVIMIYAAPAGYWDRIETLKEPTTDYNWDSVNGRRQLAIRGMGYMLDHPVFGIGIDNFPMAEGQISEKAQNRTAGTGIRWAAAHNSFVQAGAELGIPGLLVWGGLLIGSFLGVRRLRSRLPRRWRRGTEVQRFVYEGTTYLPIAVLGFAASSLFVSFAYQDPYYILLSLVVGFLVSYRQLMRAGLPSSGRPRRTRRQVAPIRRPAVPV